MAFADDADITVTTATGTEADAAAALGVEPPAKDKEAPAAADADDKSTDPPAPKKDGEKADDGATGEDKDEPAKPGETAEEQTARETRNAARKTSRGERRLDTFDGKIAAKRRELGDVDRQIESRKRELAGLKPAPDTTARGDKPATAPAGTEPPAPKFEFPSWEDWQDKPEHAEQSHEDYMDARTDARYQYNRQQEIAATRRQAEQAETVTQNRDFAAGVVEVTKERPDYDDALDRIQLLETPATAFLFGQVRKAGTLGPRILLHLADHPEVATRIMEAATPGQVIEELAVIKHILKAPGAASSQPGTGSEKETPGTTVKAPAPAPQPSRPATKAPAPVTPLPGGATAGRTLQSTAEDSDDADAYIEQRGQGHLLKR